MEVQVMQVTVDGEAKDRRVDRVERMDFHDGSSCVSRLVPELHDDEEAIYCLDGSVNIIKGVFQ